MKTRKPTEPGHKRIMQCDRNLVHRAAAGKFKGGVIKAKKGKGAYTRRDKTWRESLFLSSKLLKQVFLLSSKATTLKITPFTLKQAH